MEGDKKEIEWDKERVQRQKENYGLKGYDFATGCLWNKFQNYDFAQPVIDKLAGLVHFSRPKVMDVIDLKYQRQPRRMAWKGNVSEVPGAVVYISQTTGYNFKISLEYLPEDREKLERIRRILEETLVRKRKTLRDFLIVKPGVKPAVNLPKRKTLEPCGMYSSD